MKVSKIVMATIASLVFSVAGHSDTTSASTVISGAITALFVELDVNNDGQIELAEYPEVDLDIFENADRNYDGRLTRVEFKAFVSYAQRVNSERSHIPEKVRFYPDIAYVEGGHRRHKLDLYLPATVDASKPLPLVIWIHGGGWQKGTKSLLNQQTQLLNQGFALASVNYRLSRHALFPAQIHDCKAAVRFLRKHADQYGLDADHFGVWGSSAGGHLVALLGVSDGVAELEGDIGVTGVSSSVQAVVVWFGPSDFSKMFEYAREQQVPKDLSNYPLTKLLGGLPETKPELVKQVSPLTHITADDPPFLIMHGDQDKLVPLEQSVLLEQTLKSAGVPQEFMVIEGAGHVFFDDKNVLKKVHEFFAHHLIVKD